MCLEPTVPLNGNVVLNSQLLGVGTTATYSCDPGYVLAGETTRTCEDTNGNSIGVWNGSMPICEGKKGNIIHSYKMEPCTYSNHQMPATDSAQQWSSQYFLWHTRSHPG